jgi:hypothetical protein
MFNNFFNKNKDESVNNNSRKGLVKEDPILMYSIASSYVYLDSLCSASQGLAYERIGPIYSSEFPNVIDKYIFTINEKNFCEIFVYPYHDENINIIPTPFKELNPDLSEEIFELNNHGRYRYLLNVTELILSRNESIISNQLWPSEKQHVLNNLLKDLGYENELESLILDEFKATQINIPEIKTNDFINHFVSNFHNKKLVPYTPDFIQERNKKLLSAYKSIIGTINKIQAWLDNELLRKRIEINTLTDYNDNILGYSAINYCITPFCYISLVCDVFGRYDLVYGIDSRISKMLTDNMGSTLLRRIYEFTPGELEPFVLIVSLNMDCITLFEDYLKNIQNENYELIEVKRNEEESISHIFRDMYSNLELRDDISEETKKWYRR